MIIFIQKEFVRGETGVKTVKKIIRVGRKRPGRVVNRAVIKPAIEHPASCIAGSTGKLGVLTATGDPVTAAISSPAISLVAQKYIEEPLRKKFPKYKKGTEKLSNIWQKGPGKWLDKH